MPKTKTYIETDGIVHYGTDIFAVKTLGDDAYKTIYCAHEDTMEIYRSLTLPDTIHYFCGAGGYIWCLTQVGTP